MFDNKFPFRFFFGNKFIKIISNGIKSSQSLFQDFESSYRFVIGSLIAQTWSYQSGIHKPEPVGPGVHGSLVSILTLGHVDPRQRFCLGLGRISKNPIADRIEPNYDCAKLTKSTIYFNLLFSPKSDKKRENITAKIEKKLKWAPEHKFFHICWI